MNISVTFNVEQVQETGDTFTDLLWSFWITNMMQDGQDASWLRMLNNI